MKKLIQVAARPTAAMAEELMRDLILAFTRHHKYLRIERGEVGNRVIIAVEAHADDHPKIVGKDGMRISAIKRVFEIFLSRRLKKSVEVSLLGPTKGTRLPPPKFKANPNWDSKPFEALLIRTLKMALTLPFQIKMVPIASQTGVELMVNELELDDVRGAFTASIRSIFEAIGRHDGREIHFELKDEKAEDVPDLDNLEVVRDKSRPPHTLPPAVDEIEAEARERGLA